MRGNPTRCRTQDKNGQVSTEPGLGAGEVQKR